MSLEEKLELLSKADKYEFTKKGDSYFVGIKDNSKIIAEIEIGDYGNSVYYYLTGCANYSRDIKQIDMNQLEELKKIISLLKEGEE